MLITPATLNVFFTSLSTLFWQAYQQRKPWYKDIATEIPSNTEIFTVGWLRKIPTMRQWIGARQPVNAASSAYTITPQPYELTLQVDKFKILDDTWNIYGPITTEMGWQAAKYIDYNLVDLIQGNGIHAGELCEDGFTFFNTAHPVDPNDATKGTYSNDFTGAALTNNSYAFVRETMMAYLAEDGKPLGIIPNTLIVPPALEYVARTILHADFIAPSAVGTTMTGQVGPVTNVLKGSANLMVVPELATQPTTWYLADTTRAVKPFLNIMRQAPNFVYRVAPTDPSVFDLHQYIYGVDARSQVGFGFPWLCARANP